MGKIIRRFPSGAVRSDDRGRIRPDYISPYALKALGEHFAANEGDFQAINYWLGIPEQDILPSIYRHFLDLQIAMYEGDEDLIREEIKALAANSIMILHTHEIKRLGMYKEVYDKTELIDSDEIKKKPETLYEKKQRLQKELDEVSRQLRESINKSK